MPPSKKHPVDGNDILTSEFEYIAQTTMEAHEDRARASSFYLVSVGSLITAVLGTQFFEGGKPSTAVTLMLGLLFLLLTLLGASTVIQLGRLRAAWHESLLAMNQIKDFAVKHNPDLADAFRWKTKTLPVKYKKYSISYFQAVEVSLISGLMLGTSVFFFILAWVPAAGVFHWVVAIPAGIAMVFVQLAIYKWSLK